jgi:hypothetical protein
MWDSVPWAIGGQAQNSESVARTLAYLAMNGHEGVVSPGDLKVTAMTVPGSSVNVAAGVAGVLSKTQAKQAYIGRNPTVDVRGIASTGSGGGRSDMVIARILDPNVDGAVTGMQFDPALGPFVITDVIPNVPQGATKLAQTSGAGMTAIELARIDVPANTQTITQGMITDLRTLANPQSATSNYAGTLNGQTVTLDVNVWRAFPPGPVSGIYVPPWATHAAIRMETTLQYISGDGYSNFQAFMGLNNPDGSPVQDGTTLWGDQTIDTTKTTGGDGYRQPLVMPTSGLWPIPAALRGKTVSITGRVRARAASGGKIASPSSDYYNAEITFTERLS